MSGDAVPGGGSLAENFKLLERQEDHPGFGQFPPGRLLLPGAVPRDLASLWGRLLLVEAFRFDAGRLGEVSSCSATCGN